jgi:hypothetical protein
MARESKNHSLILSHPRRPSLSTFYFIFFSLSVFCFQSSTASRKLKINFFLLSFRPDAGGGTTCARGKSVAIIFCEAASLSYIRNSMMVEGAERERRRVETIRRTSLLYGMRRQTVVAAAHTASMGPIIRFVIGAAVIHCCITTLSTVG